MIFCVALAELRVLLEWEVLITPALRDVAGDCGAVRMARLGDVDDLYRVLTPLLQSREGTVAAVSDFATTCRTAFSSQRTATVGNNA